MKSELIEKALKRATDTRACEIGDGVLARTSALFREQFLRAAGIDETTQEQEGDNHDPG